MFDESKARRAVNFFERVLRHTKGRFAGQPFRLLEWQYNIVRDVFGTVDDFGLRIYRTVYLEVGKKNGKSEFAAGFALKCLVDDDEPGAEVYSAAAAKDQAGLVYLVAAAMVEAAPDLRDLCKVMRSTKRIVLRSDHGSVYRALSADGDLQDGINPHCVVVDELHRWKVQKSLALMDVLKKGTIARSQPLIFQITTAGDDFNSLCWKEHEYCRQVNDGTFTDKRYYGRIFAADPKDDWQLQSTWEKANPSIETLGGFIKLESFEKEVTEAKNEPAKLAAFRRFQLGIWGIREKKWMPYGTWSKGDAELGKLVDRVCFMGFDLSSTTDLTSLVLLFPPRDDDKWDVLPFFWMPGADIIERERKDHVPYRQWADAGLIHAGDGDVIDTGLMRAKINWAREIFDVQEIAYDPWHASEFSLALLTDGFKIFPIRQGVQSLSEPMKKLMELSLQGKIRHAGHEVLAWNVDCVEALDDGNDNIRPIKPKRGESGKRIDGALALIMALGRATLGETFQSVYADRGVISF